MISHKVPAISTSEDSQEVPRPSSGCCSAEKADKKNHVHHQPENNKAESRDMGETQRGMNPTFGGLKEQVSSCNGVALGSDALERMAVEDICSKQSHNEMKAKTPVANNKSTTPPTNQKEAKNVVSVTKETSHSSLLPSPSTSFDPMDSQPWSHSFNGGGVAVYGEKPTAKPRHRRSPATTFPFPSPKSNRHQEYGDDEASFNLLNQSFDTISDTATYLQDFHQHAESTGIRGNGDGLSPTGFSMLGLRQHHSRDASHISLPALGQYHGVGNSGDVSPMRSFGGEGSVGHSRSMSGVEPIPVHFPRDEGAAQGYHGYSSQAGNGSTNPCGENITSNPLFVLRCARQAFSKCTFLLSCLSKSDPCPVNVAENGSFQHYQGSDNQAYQETYNDRDLLIASRRVGAAICAFGGSIEPEQASRKTSSIFRPKGEPSGDSASAGKLVSDQAYEDRLRKRYSVNSDTISWDVEENPPVESSDENETRNGILAHMNTSTGSYAQKDGKPGAAERASSHYSSVVEMTSNGKDPPRMKYRCKLCGQPKQNHSCPYRQAMQRSLGVSVRPAVNSYTAHEPGAITVALSEMNNFISYDSDQGSSEHGSISSVPPSKGTHRRTHATVTPDVLRPGVLLASEASLSATQGTEDRPEEWLDVDGRGNRKRSHSEMETEEPVVSHDTSVPFIREVPLRPEQYRAATRSKNPEPVGAFQYPTIPLTFAERRRLSDTLFVLSREIPNVTEECAGVLREAREKDMWDLAVAELLTQLVVGLYCQEGDKCLDGLQQYLLYLGVSC